MAALSPNFDPTFEDGGAPAAGYLLHTYATGTTTPLVTYQDQAGTIPNTNPIVLDAAGRAKLWLVGTDEYRLHLTTPLGATVSGYPIDDVAGVSTAIENNALDVALRADIASTASGKGASLVGQPATSMFAATDVKIAIEKLVSHAGETYYANDYPWLVTPGLTTDQSAAMQAAFDFVKGAGGELKFKPGTYLGRIDFSGAYKQCVFDGQGAVFRPFVSTQGEVFYADNGNGTLGSFGYVNAVFRNVNVLAKTLGASSDTDPFGHPNFGVNFRSASAKWYDSSFQYGQQAAYYGFYHQYGEFWSCLFGAAVFSGTSAGCFLDGNTATEAPNENRFYGPKFFSCKNGLIIKGGVKNRISCPTIQDIKTGGVAGIWLTTDATGFGADGTEICGVYAELNHIPCITVGVAPNTVISGVEFLTGAESITSTHCYNLTLRDVNGYSGGSVVLSHPTANADTASLLYQGGNVYPNVDGLIHNGPTNITIDQPGRSAFPAGQSGSGGVHLQSLECVGFRANVPRSTATNIFRINQQTFSTAAFRYAVFELSLFAVYDNASAANFGFSARGQRQYLFVSNNAGTLSAYVSTALDGADMGANTAFTAPGAIAVAASVVSDDVVISATYSGAGSSPAATDRINIGYIIRGVSGNPTSITKL